MKKNDVFQFTAPNGAVVTAVVVAIISSSKYQTIFLCYGQNRLFECYEHVYDEPELEEPIVDLSIGETLVDYAVLPDYDSQLKVQK